MKGLTQWEMQFDTLIRQPCAHSFKHRLTLEPHCLHIAKHDCATVCMTKRMHKHTLCISTAEAEGSPAKDHIPVIKCVMTCGEGLLSTGPTL